MRSTAGAGIVRMHRPPGRMTSKHRPGHRRLLLVGDVLEEGEGRDGVEAGLAVQILGEEASDQPHPAVVGGLGIGVDAHPPAILAPRCRNRTPSDAPMSRTRLPAGMNAAALSIRHDWRR